MNVINPHANDDAQRMNSPLFGLTADEAAFPIEHLSFDYAAKTIEMPGL
jgi:hypothetical protein